MEYQFQKTTTTAFQSVSIYVCVCLQGGETSRKKERTYVIALCDKTLTTHQDAENDSVSKQILISESIPMSESIMILESIPEPIPIPKLILIPDLLSGIDSRKLRS